MPGIVFFVFVFVIVFVIVVIAIVVIIPPIATLATATALVPAVAALLGLARRLAAPVDPQVTQNFAGSGIQDDLALTRGALGKDADPTQQSPPDAFDAKAVAFQLRLKVFGKVLGHRRSCKDGQESKTDHELTPVQHDRTGPSQHENSERPAPGNPRGLA
jgi:hypothetical protein